MPPFEKSVKPIVADLQMIRAHIARYGFTRTLYDNEHRATCGCFIGTGRILGLTPDLTGVAVCLRLVDYELVARYGDSEFPDGVFDEAYLSDNDIDATAALAIIDAAIARES